MILKLPCPQPQINNLCQKYEGELLGPLQHYVTVAFNLGKNSAGHRMNAANFMYSLMQVVREWGMGGAQGAVDWPTRPVPRWGDRGRGTADA